MKERILRVGIIICLTTILFSLTGCGSNNETQHKQSQVQQNNNKESQAQQNNNSETNATDETQKVETVNLTLENFKKIMQIHDLTVKQMNENKSNSINVLYQAYDEENSIQYTLNVFKNEESAIRHWNNVIKTRYENSVINIITDKSDEHTSRLEKLISNGTYIDFRENNNILSVYISKDEGNEGVAVAKSVIAELGYGEVSSSNETQTSEENNKALQVGNYTLNYGTYNGTATSGGYTLTSTIKLTESKIVTETEEIPYKVEGNKLVATNGDVFKIIVTGNNAFENAEGVYKYTYKGE